MSTSGGATWKEIDKTMDDGYALAHGSFYAVGCMLDAATQSRKMVIYKSVDDGKTWKKNTLGDKEGYLKAIAVHPSDKNILLAGGQCTVRDGIQSKLYKSTNAGETWNEILAMEISKNSITALQYDPLKPERVLAATRTGLFLSEDGASSWSKAKENIAVTSLVADAKKPGRFFAGTPKGVLASEDGGKSWSEMNKGLTVKSVLCLEFDSKNSILYAGTSNGGVMRMNLK
ncbi:MAG: hypothetical protein V1799_16470 [bacterium]